MKYLNDTQEDIGAVLKCVLSIMNPCDSHKEPRS